MLSDSDPTDIASSTTSGLRRGLAVVAIAAAFVLTATGLTGCGVVSTVKNVAHNVEGNKSTIDGFTSKMSSSAAKPFEATYVTTGANPATVVYAVRPPKDLAFKDSSTGGSTGTGALDLVVNSSGEFACTPPSSSAGSKVWSCQKLPPATAAVQNEILDFYTPAHWVTFLKGFSLAAGFAGDKVTQSSQTVNGFSTSCVDFRASGVPGISTICTTAQGILGYVKVAGDSTGFELKSYSSSPDSSEFALPAGAKITTAS